MLRAVRLRATRTRIAVLDVMFAAIRPMSHTEVAMKLPASDRITIFRALGDLARVGVITRIDAGDRIWRFEITPDRDGWHPHFVCVRCRAITCMRTVDVILPHRGVPASVKERRVQVFMHGRCDDCAEAS